MTTLSLEKITKSYAQTPVLLDVNIDVDSGEFLVLLGPSGCGKSTLLHAIAGLHSITSGDIVIDGKRVNDVPCQDRDIAMVFQSYALYPSMTVAQNIGFPLEMRKVGATEREKAVMEVARLLRIDHLLNRKPGQLSGGQRQRVAIARAIASHPSLVIADEAVSALDVSVQAQVLNLLAELQADLGLSFLFISHDIAVVERISHYVGVMYLGRLVEVGPRPAVFEDARHPYTKTLMAAVPAADPRRRRIHEAPSAKSLASPIFPLGHKPEPSNYDEVTQGHFVLRYG